MRRPLRLALVVVGLAGALYGAASLTGGWMGTPPWWHRLNPQGSAFVEGVGRELLRTGVVVSDSRRWISGAVVAVGLLIAVLAAWPTRRTGWRAAGERYLCLLLFTVGFNAVLLGTASLTGQWLGRPPWSDKPYLPGPTAQSDPSTAGDPNGDGFSSLVALEARPGREWISGGVVAAGLALVAVVAWPRRRAGAVT